MKIYIGIAQEKPMLETLNSRVNILKVGKVFVFDKNCTMNVSFDVGIFYEPIRGSDGCWGLNIR